MNSFYSSDEDVAWGQVTPREIKRHMKGQVRKKPHKRHSISNLPHNPKETVISLETSILNDITNMSNSSGTATEYLIINDTFEETEKNSNIDSPTVHVHSAMMLDKLPATMVNKSVLSDDAGYDISIPLSENDICTPCKAEDSLIIISDDDFEGQNRHENNFDFKQGGSDLLGKLKYERLSNYQGDTSDYQENVSIKSDDASKDHLNVSNCLSFLSVDEDSGKKSMSTVRDDHVTLQCHDPERDSEHSILLEKEFSPHIRDSCEFILENKVDSLACQDCQSGDEIELMSQLDYESASNGICDPKSDNSDEQHYDSENIQNTLNISRHSLSELDKTVATDEETKVKCMPTDTYYHHVTLQDHNPGIYGELSIILEKELSQQIQDPSENKENSMVSLDCQSINEIELMLNGKPVGNEACHPKCDNSYEQCDMHENTQKGLNVSRHSLSQLNKYVATDEDTEERCMSQEIQYSCGFTSGNKNESLAHLAHSEGNNSYKVYDVPENTQKVLNVSRHNLSKLSRDMNISLYGSIQNSSTPQKKGDVRIEDECEPEYFQNHKSDGSADVAENTHKDLNVSRHNLSKLSIDMNISLYGSIQNSSTPQKKGDVHVEDECEQEYFQNHKSDGSEDVPENTQKGLNVSRHSLSELNKDVATDEDTEERCMSIDGGSNYVTLQDDDTERNNKHSMILGREVCQQIQDGCGYISGNKKESLAHLSHPEYNNSYKEYDVPKNTQQDLNVSRHNSSKLSRDMNVSLYDGIQNNSTLQKKGDVHVENSCEQECFHSHKSDGSDDSNMNKCNDSSNNEELNNTLDMVERMLNEHLEIHGKSVDKKNYINSTLASSASNDKSRIPKLLKSPQIGDTFKVPQTSLKPKLHTPKSASKLNFKDVVSPVGLYIKYSPKPVLKQNVNAVDIKGPTRMKKIATSPQVLKPIRNCQDFPAAIYKPSKKQVTSSAKKLFLPPSLEKMVQEPTLVKHEGLKNRHHNESDINRLLLSESELTRYSISDSVLESSSQDTSVLTMKHTLK